MAQIFLKATPQIEADRHLLKFNSFEEYLDSLATTEDTCYLQNIEAARTIANLGYRCAGETPSKEQFHKRVADVLRYLYPPYQPYELASEGIVGPTADPLIQELCSRERSNRIGILSTIIYLRTFTKNGVEISGYIDYTERLMKEDWKPFFRGKKKLLPRKSDLGFYNWKSRYVASNHSFNYHVIQHPVKGLLFRNRFDRKVINLDPCELPGINTIKKRVYTKMHELCILFDHLVRQRI